MGGFLRLYSYITGIAQVREQEPPGSKLNSTEQEEIEDWD